MTTAVLLDGALLHRKPQLAALSIQSKLLPLYADLGDAAASVGPYLLLGKTTAELGSADWPLPERLSASDLETPRSAQELITHLQSIRYLYLADDSQFFLRFADMRAMAATMEAVYGSHQAQELIGPITTWSFTGRDSQLVHLVNPTLEKAGHHKASTSRAKATSRVTLTQRQLDRLLNASLSDRLAHAVVEINEPGLDPTGNAAQFKHVQAAAVFIQTHSVESFPMQRAIALRALTSNGQCLEQEEFARDVLEEAKKRDGSDHIATWISSKSKSIPPTFGATT